MSEDRTIDLTDLTDLEQAAVSRAARRLRAGESPLDVLLSLPGGAALVEAGRPAP